MSAALQCGAVSGSDAGVPCFRPITCWQPLDGGAVSFRELRDHRELEIPCGQCIGCRLSRQNFWAFRCLAEASLHEQSWFATLTYAPEHLPQLGALRHRDWQLFAKRTRKSLGAFRYLMCGEYGEQTLRPHYHALLFGLRLPDAEQFSVRRGYPVYRSQRLSSIWRLGHVELGSVTASSARYCAQYVLKSNVPPEVLDPVTGEITRLPEPYGRMSLRPGLGDAWIRKYYPEVLAHRACYAQDKRQPIPQRFKHILTELAPDEMEQLKQEAIEKASASPDLTRRRLKDREEIAWRRVSQLREVRSHEI